QAIGKKTDVPVLIKITPEMGAFRLIPAAYMYMAAGAVGVTCSHNFFTFAPPDIYNGGLPDIPFMDKVASVATQGSWHRFACYRDVGSVVKYCPGFDVSACGGLVIPEQCIEAMMLGARSVQLSSGLMSNGISYISQVLDFMRNYMEEQGYNKVDDFIGMAQKHVVEYGEMIEWWHAHPVVAKIDYLKCDKCGKCLDNWCWATDWENGKPKVDPKLCSGCSICVLRCTNGARSLVPVKVDGKMPEFLPRVSHK
ncbi:hypothetical protein ACFLWG_04535, partial [Chloroflexota bacterium]